MPLTRLAQTVRNVAGWFRPTPVELVLICLVGALVYWGAVPRYVEWRFAQRLRSERIVVQHVRNVLADHVVNNRPCPSVADTCADGRASECPLLGRILRDPVRSSEWRKESGVYIGPAGGRYRYEGASCQFLQIDPQSHEE